MNEPDLGDDWDLLLPPRVDPRVRNLTGLRFGRLLVLERDGSDKHGCATWLCVCDCGETIVAPRNNLLKGKVRSCGCLLSEYQKLKKKNSGLRT